MIYKLQTKRLRHVITLLTNTAISEIERETWIEKGQIYAEIQPFCNSKFTMLEGLQFNHIISELLFIFHVRFTDIITAKMRISFKNRIFEIKRIIDLAEQNQCLQIIALEIIQQ